MKICYRLAGSLICLAAVLLSVRATGQVVLANSETEFSGVQGQDDWSYGYRDVTNDGGAPSYDPDADFIPFADTVWNGTAWDLAPQAPWTVIGTTASHPNGTNNSPAHWPIRRWTAPASDLTGPTILAVTWSVAKVNPNGTGVTGQLHLNGELKNARAIAGNDTAGFTITSVLTVDAGDHVDLALTAVGPTGDTADGSDGSATRMVIETVVDSDGDLIGDSWEESFFPGDLSVLGRGSDYDADGLSDEEEYLVGTNPTNQDTDGDGLLDLVENNDRVFVSAEQTGSSPLFADTDNDGVSDGDEVNGDLFSDPNLVDTDLDGSDDAEERLYGSDPNDAGDTPLSLALADSRTEFSGVDGQNGWRWGYRNLTLDGGATDYDAETDFIPFPVDGSNTRSAANFWDGNSYDWANDGGNVNPPWTALARETTHPGGTNNAEEHWTIRRWTVSGLDGETAVRVFHHARKNGPGGDGVTGSIHLNGVEVDSETLAGNNTTGFYRVYYLKVVNGDTIDQVLTPEGLTNRADGNDGSSNWMTIDTRIPEVPIHSNGKYFIPPGAADSDGDGLADFWEEEFFPGDLTRLQSGQDADGDGLNDEDEMALSTLPDQVDTDGDLLSDGDEVALGLDPSLVDTDGDGFGDAQEVATGFDPTDAASNIANSPDVLADSQLDFAVTGNPQGEMGWDYGYYNITANGTPSGSADFISFPSDGSFALSGSNFWDGAMFDWVNPDGTVANPPWTTINPGGGHPNGDNNGDVHWAGRRWTTEEGGPFAVSYQLAKLGIGGNGTTAVLLVNGQPVDQLTVAGNDAVGQKRWFFVNTSPGDTIELMISPEGVDGLNVDGNDNSAFRMWIDSRIPDNPFQPDGSPFVPGAGGGGVRVLAVSYDKENSSLTMRWTSRSDREYAVRRLESSDPITWSFLGGGLLPGPDGETEVTFENVTDDHAILQVLELEP
jgi:hypothetical protein